MPDRVLLSPWVRRLARIEFLGALGHAPGCRSHPTRLDHSTGVARLALETGREAGLPEPEIRLLVTAALLHDVGHFPLSHTAEAAFRALLGADHHDLARFIVLGGGPVAPESALAPALRAGGLDPEAVLGVLAGTGPLGALLSGAVNLDTLDGIPRAARAFGMRAPKPPERPFVLHDGELMIRPGAIPAVDRFWRLKNRVYREVINAPAHAALELRVCALVGRLEERRIPKDLLHFDDAALLDHLGIAASSLAPDDAERESRFVTAADPAVAPVRILREYAVNPSVKPEPLGLRAADWGRRWTAAKHRWFLLTRSPAVQMLLPSGWETEGRLP